MCCRQWNMVSNTSVHSWNISKGNASKPTENRMGHWSLTRARNQSVDEPQQHHDEKGVVEVTFECFK